MIATDDDGLVRLQKLLAQSGVASRRKCEELMLDGLVEVDGEVVTRLGTKVDPTTAVIRVDGKRLPPISPHVYLVLNKPRGVVSTMSDPEGRRTLGDVVADRPERLFHVGRLDTDTSGLLLMTNDGDFAQRMAHPSYEVDKTYVAEVDGEVTKATVATLLDGVTLDDGPVTVSQARIISVSGRGRGAKSIVELVIHEGRNRIVRRLLEQLDHPVRRLTRTADRPGEAGRPGVRRAARPDPRRARRAARQRPDVRTRPEQRPQQHRRVADPDPAGPGRDDRLARARSASSRTRCTATRAACSSTASCSGPAGGGLMLGAERDNPRWPAQAGGARRRTSSPTTSTPSSRPPPGPARAPSSGRRTATRAAAPRSPTRRATCGRSATTRRSALPAAQAADPDAPPPSTPQAD